MRRNDDGTRTFARGNDRLFRRRGCWYVQTREGNRGPFPARSAAQLELSRYVETMAYLESHQADLPANVDCGDVTLVEMDRSGLDPQ